MESDNKKWYDKTVLVIFLLVIFFPVGLYGLWKSNTFSGLWKSILTILVIIVVFAALSDDKKASTTPIQETAEVLDTVAIDTTAKTAPTEVKTKWNYSEQANEMDDNTTYFAQVEANDLLDFDFPYNGGVTASIVIRNKNGKKDAMIQISKGQFMTKIDDNTIRVKFDNNKPITYSYSEPSDNSTTTIFISSASSFISKLKKAEQTIIECEFYSNGVRAMKFETKGLVWKH